MDKVKINPIWETTADNIAEDSLSWMRQNSCFEPKEIDRRIKKARGLKDVFRAIVGFFIKPHFNDSKSLYVFEGLRNKEYMRVFNPDSIVIVGSHLEKKYAETHGYGFCWSFPMVSAAHSKMYRGWSIPLNRQIKFWVSKLSHFENVVFFLYEDTQPLGIFFVYLAKIFKNKIKSVCIQHGYFCILNNERRCDGVLSDINFVWDDRQIGVIGCNRSTAFVIGLPYLANAAQSSEIIVVLVGTGTPDDGGSDYETSIKAYSHIHNRLIQSLGLKVFYRPHPNEWVNGDLIAELRKKFSLIDDLEKTQRLNGPKAVFIGTVSSLLYEAGVAGHFVVHLELHEMAVPVFERDIVFGPAEIDNLIEWFSLIKSEKYLQSPRQTLSKLDPRKRFVAALHSAKLIDNDDVK